MTREPTNLTLEQQAHILKLLAEGKKIQAVKWVREVRVISLKEAMDWVNMLQATKPEATDEEGHVLEVVRLLNAHQKLEAIKYAKDAFGLPNLIEGRKKVDQIEAKYVKSDEYRVQPPLPKDVADGVKDIMLKNPGAKIEAIKYAREKAHLGLKEAKEAVEDIIHHRKDWPNISWFLYRQVERDIMPLEYRVRNLPQVKECLKRAMEELSVDEIGAEQLVQAIIDGRIPVPPAPPKYRSIDESWECESGRSAQEPSKMTDSWAWPKPWKKLGKCFLRVRPAYPGMTTMMTRSWKRGFEVKNGDDPAG